VPELAVRRLRRSAGEKEASVEVAVGIDTHKRSLAAAAVDALGRVLGVREFGNDPTGHRSLARWVRERG
jgi:hypothetical protein